MQLLRQLLPGLQPLHEHLVQAYLAVATLDRDGTLSGDQVLQLLHAIPMRAPNGTRCVCASAFCLLSAFCLPPAFCLPSCSWPHFFCECMHACLASLPELHLLAVLAACSVLF